MKLSVLDTTLFDENSPVLYNWCSCSIRKQRGQPWLVLNPRRHIFGHWCDSPTSLYWCDSPPHCTDVTPPPRCTDVTHPLTVLMWLPYLAVLMWLTPLLYWCDSPTSLYWCDSPPRCTSVTHPLTVLQESLVALLPVEAFEVLLSVAQHCVHMGFVLHCKLKGSGK